MSDSGDGVDLLPKGFGRETNRNESAYEGMVGRKFLLGGGKVCEEQP